MYQKPQSCEVQSETDILFYDFEPFFSEIWSAIDNALSFWATFCPFTQLTTPKIKTWKKMKKARRYYHFTLVYHK